MLAIYKGVTCPTQRCQSLRWKLSWLFFREAVTEATFPT
jgi:hypothetical protein